MRTTVDIDGELLDRLHREAHRRRISFKQVLNHAIRHGLTTRSGRSRTAYRCPTFAMGTPHGSVRLDKALALVAALEDEEVSRELELRK